jgi:hypothetical protein
MDSRIKQNQLQAVNDSLLSKINLLEVELQVFLPLRLSLCHSVLVCMLEHYVCIYWDQVHPCIELKCIYT